MPLSRSGTAISTPRRIPVRSCCRTGAPRGWLLGPGFLVPTSPRSSETVVELRCRNERRCLPSSVGWHHLAGRGPGHARNAREQPDVRWFGKSVCGDYGWGIQVVQRQHPTWETYGTGLPNFVVRAMAGMGAYMYAGTDGGSFFGNYTLPGWTQVNAGLTNVRAFSFARTTDGTLYVGTWRSGVFKLPNGSSAWERLHLGLPIPTYANDLAVDDNGTLFLGTDGNGVYRLLGGSTTWQAVNTGLGIMLVYSLAHRAGDGLYAGTAVGVYRLPIGMTTWVAASSGLGNVLSRHLLSTGRTLCAGMSTSLGVYGLPSGGTTWEAVGTGWSGGTVKGIVRDGNGTLFAGTSSGVSTLPSGGTTWPALNTGLSEPSVQDLVIDASGILYAGTYGGCI